MKNDNQWRLNWADYFDHIYCIHYIDYKEREEEMKEELTRVGLLDSEIFSFKYTFNTPLDDVLLKSTSFSCERGNSNFKKSALNLAIGHYSAMKEAIGLGYKRVLFIEDDMAFLKDWELAKQILDNIPKSADVIMLDKVGIDGLWQKYYEVKPINDYFANHSVLWSTGCYALSLKGMEHVVKCQEKKFNVADFYINSFSPLSGMNIVMDNIRRCFSKTSLALQKPSSGETITDHGETKWVYNQPGLSSCGADYSLYNF